MKRIAFYRRGIRYDSRKQTSHQCARLTKPRLFQFASVRSGISRKRCVLRGSADRCELGQSKAYVKIDPTLYSTILRDRKVSNGAFRLWHLFREMTGKNPTCWPGQRYIRKALGCSFDSIAKWTKELEELGYIQCRRGNQKSSSCYLVTTKIVLPLREQGATNNGAIPVPATGAELNSGELNSITKSNLLSPEALEIAKVKFFEDMRLLRANKFPTPI